VSDAAKPASSQPADNGDDTEKALHAVQEAMDRRDNGGAANRQPPAAPPADGGK
jgi:hypothetical protein